MSIVIKKLEEDALNVLRFMASNGLVANPQKTAFMILGLKQDITTNPIHINIGKEKILADYSAKLLGITLDCNQKWKSQIQGCGGVISVTGFFNLAYYVLATKVATTFVIGTLSPLSFLIYKSPKLKRNKTLLLLLLLSI